MKLNKRTIDILTYIAIAIVMIVYCVLKITNVIDANYIWLFLIAGVLIIAIATVSQKLKAKCDQEALSLEDGENAKVQAKKQKVRVAPGMLGLSFDVATVILMVVAWALAVKNNMLAAGNEDFPRANFVALSIIGLISLVMSYLPKTIGGIGGIRSTKQVRDLAFHGHALAVICALLCLSFVLHYMDMTSGVLFILAFVAMIIVLEGWNHLRRRGYKTD